jgi:ATP-dependent 26S proteasome regulatory subunit
MEQYGGISLLATNLRQNMDEAFVRRLAFIVQFPFPNAGSRLRIWKGIWPSEILLKDDVDLEYLAAQFKLSGGNIKNVAVAAAFHAASDGGCVSMAHLLRATRREYQKMDKVLPETELKGLVEETVVPKEYVSRP